MIWCVRFAGQIVMFLDRVDTVILKICPFLAAGVLAGAVYWTAITYGAITIMQVSEEMGFRGC